jgi:hypothetical protein
MPPKTPSVDGISKPAVIPNPPVAPSIDSTAPSQPNSDPKPVEDKLKPVIKNQVKASKVQHGPVIPILITLLGMVLLIALAYFAYNKSK